MLVGRPVAGHPAIGQKRRMRRCQHAARVVLDAEEQRRVIPPAREQHTPATALDGVLDELVVLASLDSLVPSRVSPTGFAHVWRTLFGHHGRQVQHAAAAGR